MLGSLGNYNGFSAGSRISSAVPGEGFIIKTKPRFRYAEAGDFYPAHFVQAQWA